MGEETQVTLAGAQYALLKRESERTGIPLADLIGHAVSSLYGSRGLAESFGAWEDREFTGSQYVERLRRGQPAP